MTKYYELTSWITVAPQVSDEDFAVISAAGYKSVFNIRPDDEAGEYLKSGDAGKVARAFGLEYRHMPVDCLCVTDEFNVEGFAEAIEDLPGPIFIYCRSGTRATILWALVNAGTIPTEEIIAVAKKNGYDLAVIREDLEERAAELQQLQDQSRPDHSLVA